MTSRTIPLARHLTADHAIAHFVAPCPTCAHLLIERLSALQQGSIAATRAHFDAHGDHASDAVMQAHEARNTTLDTALHAARIYRVCHRLSGWPHFGAGHNTWREPAVDPKEFCSTFLPGRLDTPLTIPERERATITRACCHAARVRSFLNSLGASYA